MFTSDRKEEWQMDKQEMVNKFVQLQQAIFNVQGAAAALAWDLLHDDDAGEPDAPTDSVDRKSAKPYAGYYCPVHGEVEE